MTTKLPLTDERLSTISDYFVAMEEHYSDPADRENFEIFSDAKAFLAELQQRRKAAMCNDPVEYLAPADVAQGWKIAPTFINKVQESIGYDEECECWEGTPSMEIVEAVLLAASKITAQAMPVVPDEVEHVAAVLELIGSFEAADIDCDTVDLRFEIDDVDTGSDVSITEYVARGAAIIRMLAGNVLVIPDGCILDELLHTQTENESRTVTSAANEPYGFTDGDRRGMIYKPEHADRLNEPLPVYRHAQQAPVVPDALIKAVDFYQQVKRENPSVETGAWKDAVEWVLKEACLAAKKDES